jgi:hypothetical protein
MRRSLGTAQRAPAAAARVLALAAVLAASGVIAGTASASKQAGHQAGTVLAYTCRSLSGRVDVTTQVVASFPAAGQVGKPIAPGAARITVTIPHAAVSGLVRHHVRAITATAQLTTGVATHGTPITVPWPAFKARRTHLPASGSLALTTSGTVPLIAPAAPGKVTVTAASLMVVLTPHSAPGIARPGPNSPGSDAAHSTPKAPVGVRLTCIPVPGQNATLATVLITGQRLSRHARKPAGSMSGSKFCFPEPRGGLQLNPKFPLPTPPKGAKVTFPTPVPGCAWVVGYSNVRKLNGSALVGPGKTDINLPVREVIKSPTYFEEDAAGQLDFRPCPTCKIVHGLPPAHSTFLGFGFVPVSATLQLTQVGTANIYAIGTAFTLTSNTIFSEVSLRVYGVKVNGVPLNVGPHCESAHPIFMELSGNPNGVPPYTIQSGGPLTGTITIPPFKGCGVGENLDPLFTASISGPGNFVILTQGNLCTLQTPPFGCPPTIPKPVRKVSG